MIEAQGSSPLSGEVAAQPPEKRRFALFQPLRSRDFRLIWGGFTLSLLAFQLSFVGIAWLTLQLTGSPLSTGGVLAAAAVPRGVLGLLAGAASDRFGARRIGVISSLVRVAAMGSLAALALKGVVNMPEIYALAVVFGGADAFYGPSRASLLPQTVSDDQLEPATALEQTTQALGSLLGPALAGVVVAKLGAGYALGGDALLFIGVTFATAAVRVGAPRAQAEGAPVGLVGDIVAGLRYVFGDPLLRALIVLVSAMTLAANGPVDVGLAALARYHLGGPAAFGIMLAGFGAGSLVGSLLAGVLPPGRLFRRILLAALFFAVGMPLLGVVPSVVYATLLTVGLGVVAGVISVLASAWIMRRTDASMMGRVMSLLMVTTVGLSPLSLAISGAIAQFSIPLVFLASGALMLAAAAGGAMSRTVREAE